MMDAVNVNMAMGGVVCMAIGFAIGVVVGFANRKAVTKWLEKQGGDLSVIIADLDKQRKGMVISREELVKEAHELLQQNLKDLDQFAADIHNEAEKDIKEFLEGLETGGPPSQS